MQDKLHLLENLTFEQVVCAMLGIDKHEDNQVFWALIKQLSNDAETGALKNAVKTLKPRSVHFPLMGGGSGSLKSEAKKLKDMAEDKSYKENPQNLEFSFRSEVPRSSVIEYMAFKKLAVPSSILGEKVEASNVGRTLPENATSFMFICVDVFNRYWADTKGDDKESIKTAKTIEEWILKEYKDTEDMSSVRAKEIQRVTRPRWAVSLGGRPKNN